MTLENRNIVIFEDDSDITFVLEYFLNNENINFKIANTFKEGIEICEQFKPNLIITDMYLPDGSGEEIINKFSKTEIIIMTSITRKSKVEHLLKKENVLGIIYKPVDFDKLTQTIEAIIKGNKNEKNNN